MSSSSSEQSVERAEDLCPVELRDPDGDAPETLPKKHKKPKTMVHSNQDQLQPAAATGASGPAPDATDSLPTSGNRKKRHKKRRSEVSSKINYESDLEPEPGIPSMRDRSAEEMSANHLENLPSQFAQAMVLHPNKPAEHNWQQILAHTLANNSTTLMQTLIKLTLVNATPLSENGLHMIVNKKKTHMEQLFTALQDDNTRAALRNHALYKSFWSGTLDSSAGVTDPSVLMEPSPEKLGLLRTLVSYVPKVVVRRFLSNPGKPLRAPEVETYLSCVLFADISGFTPLTESFANLGAEGVEQVTTHLNAYFGRMIKIIMDFGGDIVKFAGDALLVIWPTDSQEALYVNSMLSAQCALALQKKLGSYTVGSTTLQLHIGMGAGSIAGIHVGGVQSRFEFFIAGDPIRQVSECEAAALPGEIFMSPELHRILKKHAIGEFRNSTVRDLPFIALLETRLRQYVPAAVLSHLETHEYLAELRTVSVLFINLNVHYENDQDSPKVLQLCVAAMQAILSRLEGTVRQFLVDDKGSVLIAAFGVPPLSHEDDCPRAVEAALEISKVLKELNVSPCIGITTGRAFCGAVGNESRREYAMVGDIVNLAARLMSAAPHLGGILCDEATTLSSRSSFSFDDLDPISVKGKKKPIPVFIPRSRISTPAPHPSSPDPKPRSLIGRQNVLALLEYKIAQLKPRSQEPGHVFVLEGDAGIGKSKIVDRIPGMASTDCEIFLGVRDIAAGSQTIYGGWSFIFNAVLDLASIKDDESIPAHIAAVLQKIPKSAPLPDLVPDWPSLAPLLNSILPLGIQENRVTASLPDQSRAEALQILLIRLLQTLVQPGSVIVLEDAHHFDSNSWTLTLAAAQQLKGVLLVVTLRPLKPPLPFAYQQIVHCQHAHSTILAPLSPDDSIRLANEFLGVRNMPKLLAEQIVAKGQGIPFIIEQLTGSLQENGSIDIVNGEARVKPGVQVVLPSTVSQLITAKFDKLSSAHKSVLKVASVIGKSFVVGLLLQLLPAGASPSELADDLRALERAGFIVEEESGEETERVAVEQAQATESNQPGSSASKMHRHSPRKKIESGDAVESVSRKGPRGAKKDTSLPKVSPLRLSKKMRGSVSNGQPLSIPLSKTKDQSERANSPVAIDGSGQAISPRDGAPPDSARRRAISKKFSVVGTLRGTLKKSLDETLSSDSALTLRDRSLSTSTPPSPPHQDFLLREFSFKHETVLEVVYGMMLFSQRRQLHAAIAAWYETTHAQNLSKFAPIVAYHLKSSEQRLDRAAAYYAQAGEQALRSFSNYEAVTFFQHALQLRKKVSKMRKASTSNSKKHPATDDADDDLFQALHLNRKLGQAFYNLGNFSSATSHLIAAIKPFKIAPLSSERSQATPDSKLLRDFSFLMSCDAHVKREVVLSLLTMARCFYYSCNRRASTYCNVVALTLAEHSNFWAEQSEAYAQSIVTAGLANLDEVARGYFRVGQQLAKEKLDLSSSLFQMAGVFHLSQAAWKESERCLKEAIDGSQKTGDRRKYEESSVFLSFNHFLRGQYRKSLGASGTALESARLRGDVQCQMLALNCQVCCHLTLGNVQKAITKLDQIRVAINRDQAERVSDFALKASDDKRDLSGQRNSQNTGDIASDINFLGLKAMLSLLQNDLKDAHDMAIEADSLLQDKSREPTAFFTFPAYMAVPEVYLRLLLRPKYWDSIGTTKKKLLKRFKTSLVPLRQFAEAFKFTWPRIHLLEGLGALAEGHSLEQAKAHWETGLKSAKQLGMNAELATIEKHLIQATGSEPTSFLANEGLLTGQESSFTPNVRRTSEKRNKKKRAKNPQTDDTLSTSGKSTHSISV